MLNECSMLYKCAMLDKRDISSEQGRHQLLTAQSYNKKDEENKEMADHDSVIKRLKWLSVPW